MKKERYIDNYGQVWVKVDEYYVRRERDGTIGVWDKGIGLQELAANPHQENK